MPIIHQCEQGTLEWLMLRCGIPTASEFHRIVTPGGKLSKQAEGYMYNLLAEYVVGHPIAGDETAWMQRGHDLEDEAIKAYEFQKEVETDRVGFVTSDDGKYGASPDRLIGDRASLEIKCPKHNTHVGYMLTGKLEADYTPQLQGQLYVTGREYVDIVAYHPEMPHVVIRVERDEEYINTLALALGEFVEILAAKRLELDQRFGPFKREPIQRESTIDPSLLITDEDIALIMGHRFPGDLLLSGPCDSSAG